MAAFASSHFCVLEQNILVSFSTKNFPSRSHFFHSHSFLPRRLFSSSSSLFTICCCWCHLSRSSRRCENSSRFQQFHREDFSHPRFQPFFPPLPTIGSSWDAIMSFWKPFFMEFSLELCAVWERKLLWKMIENPLSCLMLRWRHTSLSLARSAQLEAEKFGGAVKPSTHESAEKRAAFYSTKMNADYWLHIRCHG